MSQDLLSQALGLLLCAIILARAEPAINRMSQQTVPLVRLAFILLAAGALAGIIAILAGTVPPFADLLLTAGVAALLFCDRRIRILTRHRPHQGIPHATR